MLRRMVRDTAGAAMVEMALVLPIILLLTMGSVEVGLYLFQTNAASKATQLGARWAAVHAPVSAALRAHQNSTAWWANGTLGKNCMDPKLGIVCQGTPNNATITCTTGSADCAMGDLLAVMQRAFPELTASDIKIAYVPFTTGSIGFVGRPGGVPVEVAVTVCKPFTFAFLSGWIPQIGNPPAPAGCEGKPSGFYVQPSTTRLPSESFGWMG